MKSSIFASVVVVILFVILVAIIYGGFFLFDTKERTITIQDKITFNNPVVVVNGSPSVYYVSEVKVFSDLKVNETYDVIISTPYLDRLGFLGHHDTITTIIHKV